MAGEQLYPGEHWQAIGRILQVDPATVERILRATYLAVNPTCPDCGHAFSEATLREVEAHILVAHATPREPWTY